MIELLKFFGFLFILFLLSKVLANQLGLFIYRITESHDWTVRILAILFLPGTIIHEFSHAAIAQGLGVPVGDITLMPEVHEKGIKLGSVQVAGTDPFRRFFIGIAPIAAGMAVIFLTLAIYQRLASDLPFWTIAAVYYLVFEIGNSMFSSRRDLEGAIELLAALFLVFGILYLFGVKFSAQWVLGILPKLEPFFGFGAKAMLKIVLLDIGVILAAVLGNAVLKRR